MSNSEIRYWAAGTAALFALMILACGSGGGSGNNDCDPLLDLGCACTLDQDGVTDVTDECIDDVTDAGDPCSCSLEDDGEPDPNPAPEPDPNPAPPMNPDPNPAPEPDPNPEVELPSLGTDAVVRYSYAWTILRMDAFSFTYFAKFQPVSFVGLDENPEPMHTILRGRRLIGGDCVAYIEEGDNIPERPVEEYPTPSITQSSVGSFTTTFMDAEGRGITFVELVFEQGRYGYFKDSGAEEGQPVVGNVRMLAPSRGEFTARGPGDTDITVVTPGTSKVSIDFDVGGFSLGMQTETAPAVYISFDMVGQTGRAHVHCVRATDRDGRAQLTIPDLTALADEVDWIASRDFSQHRKLECGPTSIDDPLLSGHYGIAEQAVRGQVVIAEHRNREVCVFADE